MSTLAATSKTLLSLGMEEGAITKVVDGDLRIHGAKSARWRWLTARRGVLYAFCSEAKVLYVSREPATLSKSLARLVDAALDAKAADLNGAIRKLLKAGKEVRILVWADLQPLTWGGLAVDLGAGIEASLIAFFRPPWNKD